MKALADGGVVDERLNVYGVSSLKVAGKKCIISAHKTHF